MKTKLVIGGVIIVVFLVWGASAFLKTTIRYVPITKARNCTRTVQVMGKIDFSTVKYDAEARELTFEVLDPEATDPHNAPRLAVVYHGVVPGNFDQAKSVVLKGKPDASGRFVASQMLVKCPSKYQGEGGDGFRDMKEHQQAST